MKQFVVAALAVISVSGAYAGGWPTLELQGKVSASGIENGKKIEKTFEFLVDEDAKEVVVVENRVDQGKEQAQRSYKARILSVPQNNGMSTLSIGGIFTVEVKLSDQFDTSNKLESRDKIFNMWGSIPADKKAEAVSVCGNMQTEGVSLSMVFLSEPGLNFGKPLEGLAYVKAVKQDDSTKYEVLTKKMEIRPDAAKEQLRVYELGEQKLQVTLSSGKTEVVKDANGVSMTCATNKIW